MFIRSKALKDSNLVASRSRVGHGTLGEGSRACSWNIVGSSSGSTEDRRKEVELYFKSVEAQTPSCSSDVVVRRRGLKVHLLASLIA
ncbi:hypothetical protein TNCV_4785581 [Trichonephila clavipes]|nr:hypothetical protein TNCV_4785581 [Trichonephila clavipes]